MTEIFLKMLNISITASWIILAVLMLRFLFPKAPKWISCLLWGIVALRLVMPFSLESTLSLIPSAEVIPQDIAVSQTPAIHSGIPAVNSTINPLFTLHAAPEEHLLEKILSVASTVWLVGAGILLIYSAVTYLRLRWQIRASISIREDIYLCDDVDSPFVFGVFQPRIYLPSGIEKEQMQFVLAHENAHIKRRDHWWKPLGFLLLTIYWFNPLMWLAYILLCRDIERACDEKVIAGMDNAGKKGYAAALLACSVHRRMVMACPVAFGEVGVKTRIKGVLNYRKPAFWIILISTAVCAITAVCFLTDPVPCVHEYHSQITIAATCTEKGMETRTCAFCEHSYTIALEKIPHTYDTGVVTIEPTCITRGRKKLTCTDCGAQKIEIVKKTVHIAGTPFFVTEPNCTQKGTRSATCAYCHTVFITEVLPTNDVHNLQEKVLVEPTCAAPGEGVHACTRCNYAESCTYEQLEHNFKTRTVREARCDQEGLVETTCTGCDYYNSAFIKHGNHKWEPYNSKYKVCAYCGWRTAREEYPLFENSTGGKKPEDLFSVVRIWP